LQAVKASANDAINMARMVLFMEFLPW